MEIFGWQLCIFSAVVIASLLFGRRGLIVAAIAALVWTCFSIFMPWLALVQLLATGLGALIGQKCVPFSDKYRFRIWVGIALAGTAAILAALMASQHPGPHFEETAERTNPAIDPVAAPVPRSAREIAGPRVAEEYRPGEWLISSDDEKLDPGEPIFKCENDRNKVYYSNRPCIDGILDGDALGDR